MKIQPNVTPKMPDVSFGNKRMKAKLPTGLKIGPRNNVPKGLLIASIPIILFTSGTIIWRTSDYYKIQQLFKQLMKDIKEAEIKRQDSINAFPTDTISLQDAMKLDEIG